MCALHVEFQPNLDFEIGQLNWQMLVAFLQARDKYFTRLYIMCIKYLLYMKMGPNEGVQVGQRRDALTLVPF